MGLATSRTTPLGLGYGDRPPWDWAPTGEGAHRIDGLPGAGILLFDLTAHERFGLKGRGASDWFAGQGAAPPAQVNTARPDPAGAYDVLRLGSEDIVALSRPDAPSGAVGALRAAWQADTRRPKGFDGYRDEVWAWFHLAGDDLSRFMSMTCPVDLDRRRFTPGMIAQTRVAQMDCIVARTDRSGRHGFDLLFDVASSDFMQRSLSVLGETA